MKYFKSLLRVATAALSLLHLAFGWTVSSLPDPRKDFQGCGRSVSGWVCSPDGLVANHKLDIVQGDINAIFYGEDPYSKVFCSATQRNTSIELLAVVIDEVDGRGDASERVATFAQGIHDRFGVGSSECGSGAVVVVSVQDRQVHISTGQLVKHHLPSHKIEALVRGIRPQLRAEKYGKALEKLVVEVGLELSTKAHHGGGGHGRRGNDGGHDGSGIWIFAIVASFLGCACLSERNNPESRRRRQVAAQLRSLQQDYQAAQQSAYVSSSCPICLEDFAPTSDVNVNTPPPVGTSVFTDSAQAATLPPDFPSPSAPPLPSHDQKEPLLPQKVKEQPSEYERVVDVGGGGSARASIEGNTSTGSAVHSASQTRSRARAGYFPALFSGTGGSTEAGPPKVPFVLPCGHTFCQECIQDWLSRQAECPICRQAPPGGASAAVPLLSQQPLGSSHPPYSSGVGYDVYDPELEYRLSWLRQRNSRYITQAMVNDLLWQARMNSAFHSRWGHHHHHGGRHHQGAQTEDWGRHPMFLQQMSDVTQAARAADGAHGSRAGMSFGGGHSSGGGGGGW